MPVVRMPDGARVRFPDTMSREEIKGLILKKFPDIEKKIQQEAQKMEVKAEATTTTEKGDKMARYKVTAPDGRVAILEGDHFPTAETLNKVFALMPPKTDATKDKLLEEARNLKEKGYTPQQVDEWLKTHNSSFEEINNYAGSLKQASSTQYQVEIETPKDLTSQEQQCNEGFKLEYILDFWPVIVAFYTPFIICCIFAWIRRGFKESKK